jgi:hypothetical protein
VLRRVRGGNVNSSTDVATLHLDGIQTTPCKIYSSTVPSICISLSFLFWSSPPQPSMCYVCGDESIFSRCQCKRSADKTGCHFYRDYEIRTNVANETKECDP